MDDGDRTAEGHRVGRPQDLVTANDRRERGGERVTIERWLCADEAQRHRDDVRGAVRLELCEEPEALLGERERAGRAGRARGEARRLRPLPGPQRRLDPPRELGRRRGFEERAQRDLHAERSAGARDHLRREERVPAELEEAVVGAYLLGGDLEHLGEDAGEALLHRAARRCAGLVGERARVRRGERDAVDLAAARERERVEDDERRGHHVLGQAVLEEAAQIRGAGRRAARHEVRDEALVAG